jgi:hypothetical protein
MTKLKLKLEIDGNGILSIPLYGIGTRDVNSHLKQTLHKLNQLRLWIKIHRNIRLPSKRQICESVENEKN